MSKCITCGKENDGVICSHCLAKGAGKVGKVAVKAGQFVATVVPLVLLAVTIKKDKSKS